MANFETYTKKLAPWCPGVILPTLAWGVDHRGARPWPAPDRRTLAETYSCPCYAAHFEPRSFHDSRAWPHEPLNYSVFVFAFASLYLGLSQDVE